jgi:hypothetical protein
VFVERPLLPYWGRRNASITMVHEGLLGANPTPAWEVGKLNVHVEMGSVVICDDTKFVDAGDGTERHEAFQQVWGRALKTGEEAGGGRGGGAIFVHAPMTTGTHRCDQITTADGAVAALRVDFATDDSGHVATSYGRVVRAYRSSMRPGWDGEIATVMVAAQRVADSGNPSP